ncbi:hypothetical protein GWI33_018953 [Rhynchophorus ferrugineus]|uniref:Uncharacterized protein n=1 Tax=Rhynchophorus ferrugineus TaxID=354439 RepID=A0A834M4M9_RHYFE|nr:hypothetical protein GWI33_018953 [Rhynchophorus ferrugineus]
MNREDYQVYKTDGTKGEKRESMEPWSFPVNYPRPPETIGQGPSGPAFEQQNSKLISTVLRRPPCPSVIRITCRQTEGK